MCPEISALVSLERANRCRILVILGEPKKAAWYVHPGRGAIMESEDKLWSSRLVKFYARIYNTKTKVGGPVFFSVTVNT